MAGIESSWNDWLRRSSRSASQSLFQKSLVCQLCQEEIKPPTEGAFERHLGSAHSSTLGNVREEEKKSWTQELYSASLTDIPRDVRTPSSAVAPELESAIPEPPLTPHSAGSFKREGSRSPSPSSRSPLKATSRSHGASIPADTVSGNANNEDDPSAFTRGPSQRGRLWTPDDQPTPHRQYDRSNVASNHRLHGTSRSQRTTPHSSHAEEEAPLAVNPLEKEPETKPITQEQLVTEVKGIYAGLVMVESKCIEVDSGQNPQYSHSDKLTNEQWQALIGLHQALLFEHHDFFLASQHPSATPPLRRLAAKYAMPARMWRHAIHSFLELLRHRLPESLEHMLRFIYLAYSMIALLKETVPAFEDTWIECLGDLGRYRMAIEDENAKDREIWTGVSRRWYSKASNKAATTGRLYHHLAILARPFPFQQLFYYSKALCTANPFPNARDSIMTLFDPILDLKPGQPSRLTPMESGFVRYHGIMFSGKCPEKLESSLEDFLRPLDAYIARSSRKFLDIGYHIGLALCCSIVGYGNEENPVFRACRQLREEGQDLPLGSSDIIMFEGAAMQQLQGALRLASKTHNIIFRRFGDPNVLPYLHVTLAFLYYLTFSPEAGEHVAPSIPWKLVSLMLNTLTTSGLPLEIFPRIEAAAFPGSEQGDTHRPLPEDYAMRGLPWVDSYFPNKWFDNEAVDDDEKYFELPSLAEERKVRVLYLGCQIASREGKWLNYDSASHRFSPSLTESNVDSGDLNELPDAPDVLG